MKKRLGGLLTVTMLFCILFTYRAVALERVQMVLHYNGQTVLYDEYVMELFVNGEALLDLPLEPIGIDNRAYVPVREVFESLGAVVDWNGPLGQVYVGYGDTLIMLQVGSREMKVDDRVVMIEVPPLIVNDKMMVPVRFAAEALDFTVTTPWDDEQRHIYVNTPEYQAHMEDEPAAPPAVTPSPSAPPTATPPPAVLGMAVDVSGTVIERRDFAETVVTGVQVPAAGTAQVYTITAASAISRVEKILLHDNRLVIDIYNAEINMQDRTIEIADNPLLASVRAAQNQLTPEKITRVVFDLTAPVHFAVSISADRKSVLVSLDVEAQMNQITGVSFDTDGYADYVHLDGVYAPVVALFTLANEGRLVVNMPMSRVDAQRVWSVNGAIVRQVRQSQHEEHTARLVLDLRGSAGYEVSTEGGRTTIKVLPATYRNIEYDESNKRIVIDKAATGLRAADMEHLDEYLQYRYSFVLPGDYASSLGHGEYVVNDGLVNSFAIQNANGQTRIVVNESRVLAFDVTEDARYIYIQAMLPSEKYERIVIIDPGHGGGAPGTSGFGIVEKEINLDVSLRVLALLEADGRVKAYATRLTDVNPSLSERPKFANEIGDVFVSVHYNAATQPTVSGTETHYYPHKNDAEVGFTSKEMAEIMQKHLVARLGFKDRRTFSSNLQVLTSTMIPAVLVEVGFLTNAEENAKLSTQEYRDRAAQAIFDGIIEVFEMYNPAR